MSTGCTSHFPIILVLYRCNIRSLSDRLNQIFQFLLRKFKGGIEEPMQRAKYYFSVISGFGGKEIGSLLRTYG